MNTIAARTFADIWRQSAELGFTLGEKDVYESTQTIGRSVYGIDLGAGKSYSKVLTWGYGRAIG